MSRLLTVVATVAALVAASIAAEPVAAVAAVAAGGGADLGGQRFQPDAATFNPVTGSNGFTVFVRGNAALGATASAGPVAMGGNLSVGSNFTVASQTAGTFKAAGDSNPTGLLVGGNINWAGSNSGGAVNVNSSGYVKVGDLTGSTIPSNGLAPTHIVPTGG